MDARELRAYCLTKPGATAEYPVSDDEVTDWIDDSYDLVVDKLPRRVKQDLGWPGATA